MCIRDSVVVTQQMALMEPIYQLFEQQMASCEDWGETLWRDLNVNVLSEGIDAYLNKARKMAKPIRALAVSQSVSQSVTQHSYLHHDMNLMQLTMKWCIACSTSGTP